MPSIDEILEYMDYSIGDWICEEWSEGDIYYEIDKIKDRLTYEDYEEAIDDKRYAIQLLIKHECYDSDAYYSRVMEIWNEKQDPYGIRGLRQSDFL